MSNRSIEAAEAFMNQSDKQTDYLTCNALSSVEDVQEALNAVQKAIMETDASSDERRNLVQRMIKLKVKMTDLEECQFLQEPGELESLRHALIPYVQKSAASVFRLYCEVCCAAVWPLLQTTYECKTCHQIIHARCLESLSRKCVGAFLHPLEDEEESRLGRWNGTFSSYICPEQSLVEQNYRCGECFCFLSIDIDYRSRQRRSKRKERLCDYSGTWHCQMCHWGNTSPIPARIIHNWDFTPMPVSQTAFQYIGMMKKRPVINLIDLSPGLSVVTAELAAVVRQRKAVLEMKKYLTLCRVASKERLLRKLEERQHFVDNEHMFSLQDLIDTHAGNLTVWLESVLSQWRTHITTCVLCIAKGFICELCVDRSGKTDILFPFSLSVEVCPDCEAVFHRECYRNSTSCPRCERKKLRYVEKQEEEKKRGTEEGDK